MINTAEALSIILDSIKPAGTMMVSFERALGHVLANDIIAEENVPSFDNSSMDGYAVRFDDVTTIPSTLEIVDEAPAGTVSKRTLQPGEAVSIMTGAKIPSGADTVVQIEWTKQSEKNKVTILRTVKSGQNIRKAGNDLTTGATALHSGTVLRPQDIGVLASLGKNFVTIYRPPTIAILATGNEIGEVNKPLQEGSVRNSNLYALKSSVRELYCECLDLGIARDEKSQLKEKLQCGLQADVLITSGGVSAGKHDLVIETLKELGVTIKFWKVNIKPGMPFVFGMLGEKPVFGLPGNPVSTMVTFLQFVRPALMKMKGKQDATGSDISPVKLKAKLIESFSKKDGKRHFVRGFVESNNGDLIVRSTGNQTSNVLTSLAKANCLIILPEEKEIFSVGEMVEIELI